MDEDAKRAKLLTFLKSKIWEYTYIRNRRMRRDTNEGNRRESNKNKNQEAGKKIEAQEECTPREIRRDITGIILIF